MGGASRFSFYYRAINKQVKIKQINPMKELSGDKFRGSEREQTCGDQSDNQFIV
jgi:hypothetical protein